jgi:uncharacterized protein YbcV (DUF1398 family)
MFTEQQLKDAHSKVKSGADFPAYVQEIKALGLLNYEYLVTDGKTVYHGVNDHVIRSAPIYSPLTIVLDSSTEQLKHAIAIHQQGQTDFMTFCRQVAEAGVQKWVIDTNTMLCTYHDQQGNVMVAEPIPEKC